MTPGSPIKHPDDDTGVPGFPTWPRVYTLVIVSFAIWIALLTALMRVYS